MHPATVHGVGVITKLHFAIFAPFKESMTLNLAQRSSEVNDFATNQKRVYIFILVVNINLDPVVIYVSEIRPLKCRKSTIFPTPLLFGLKFGGVPFGVDPSYWGLQIAKWLKS